MNNKCPGCGANYGITAAHVGRNFGCQRCGASLVVQQDGLQIAGQSQGGQVQAGQPAADPGISAESGYAGGGYVKQPGVGVGSSALMDILLFRRMIAPWVIQILFFVGVAGAVLMGFIMMIMGLVAMGSSVGAGMGFIFGGLMVMVVGPFVVRLQAEFVIVVFRINETLTDMLNEQKKGKE